MKRLIFQLLDKSCYDCLDMTIEDERASDIHYTEEVDDQPDKDFLDVLLFVASQAYESKYPSIRMAACHVAEAMVFGCTDSLSPEILRFIFESQGLFYEIYY